MISSYWLSMISGQTLRVCPEGKPAPTFPDHALRRDHQVYRLGAFALLVRFDLECDALSVGQVLQPGPLHRGDVHEHIATAVIGLNEAIATFSIEELDRTSHRHRETPPPHCFAATHSISRIGPTGNSLPESLAICAD